MIKIFNDKKTTKIELFGTIGEDFWSEGWTLERFKNELKDIETSEVEIEIKSLGGDAFEAFAIRDAISTMPQKIITKIVGSTASAGTIISTAGDEREITENSRFLVHNASSITMGNKDEHEKTLEMLKSVDDQIIDIYHKVTKQRKSRLSALMNEERWITAQEAKEWGFVNRITKNKVINQKETVMTEDIMKLLKVSNEIDALKAVNDLVEANEKLEASIVELQNKVKEYEVAEQQAKAEEINNYLNDAVKSKKIKEDAKDKFFALAETDFELVKNTIDGIIVPAETVTKSIENVIEEGEEKIDLLKFKDNLRNNIYKNNTELYRAHYKLVHGVDAVI